MIETNQVKCMQQLHSLLNTMLLARLKLHNMNWQTWNLNQVFITIQWRRLLWKDRLVETTIHKWVCSCMVNQQILRHQMRRSQLKAALKWGNMVNRVKEFPAISKVFKQIKSNWNQKRDELIWVMLDKLIILAGIRLLIWYRKELRRLKTSKILINMKSMHLRLMNMIKIIIMGHHNSSTISKSDMVKKTMMETFKVINN